MSDLNYYYHELLSKNFCLESHERGIDFMNHRYGRHAM